MTIEAITQWNVTRQVFDVFIYADISIFHIIQLKEILE